MAPLRDALGLTMAQAVAALISYELAPVVDEAPEGVFDPQPGIAGTVGSTRRPRT